MGKPSITDVRGLKSAGYNSFTAVTAYDYWQAVCASAADVAVLNVNDVAISRLLLGRPEGEDFSTTIDETIMATKAVKRGSGDCLVVPSLPFGYYATPAVALEAATRIFKETGCDAIHMEGAPVECVKAVCDAGWPVLGHAGVTKVNISSTRATRLKGKTVEDAQAIMDYCVALEKAGCFAIVLECVPATLAEKITKKLGICTCGIGAGDKCNGQFLVTDDMLGLLPDFNPKFVKKYINMREVLTGAFKSFVTEVTNGKFPDNEYSYKLKDETYLEKVQ